MRNRREKEPQPVVVDEDLAQILTPRGIQIVPWDDQGGPNIRPLAIAGVGANMVRQCRGLLQREGQGDVLVHIKIFNLSEDPLLRPMLIQLWEQERRVLMDVGTRIRGRGLDRLIEAFAESKYLFIVTDSKRLGTLRERLDRHKPSLVGRNRRQLWLELLALVEAVRSLHSAQFLHRGIRPDNVFVVQTSSGETLRLGNFEWSVYTRSLGTLVGDSNRLLDRYAAPEILRRRFAPSRVCAENAPIEGETYASDIFSLGLLLFEVLVRPVDLGAFAHRTGYDEVTEKAWLRDRCCEIDRASADQTLDKALGEHLKGMLTWDVRFRLSDLDPVEKTIRRIAGTGDWLEQTLRASSVRLSFVALLGPDTPESIQRFLAEALGVDKSEIGTDETSIGGRVIEELCGASVFVNAGDPTRPLLFAGRRVWFTASRFTDRGQPLDMPIPFLMVRTRNDRIDGPEIGRLPPGPEGFHLIDLREVRTALNLNNSVGDRRATDTFLRLCGSKEVWRRLFEIAEDPADRLDPPERVMHRILRATSEIERELWGRAVASYQLVGPPEADEDFETVTLEPGIDPQGRESDLVGLVVQQIERQVNTFELSSERSPTAPFDETRIWTATDIAARTSAHGREQVQLKRRRSVGRGAPPPRGYLRPTTLQGNASIYARRQQLLRLLDDDVFLMKAVTRPQLLHTVGHSLGCST